MIELMYHGGKDIDKTYYNGYEPSGGPKRYEHGTGLYLTADIEIAKSYAKGARTVFAVEVDIDPSKDINRVKLDLEGLERCMTTLRYGGMGKATAKKYMDHFVETANGSPIPLAWIVNNLVNDGYAKRYAKAINQLVIESGATHEVSTYASAQLVIVYDFKIIKSVKKISGK